MYFHLFNIISENDIGKISFLANNVITRQLQYNYIYSISLMHFSAIFELYILEYKEDMITFFVFLSVSLYVFLSMYFFFPFPISGQSFASLLLCLLLSFSFFSFQILFVSFSVSFSVSRISVYLSLSANCVRIKASE